MTYRVITKKDYKEFTEGTPNNKVDYIWASIVTNLDSEDLKNEARYKGYDLVMSSGYGKSAKKVSGQAELQVEITVPGGSQKLIKSFRKSANLIKVVDGK